MIRRLGLWLAALAISVGSVAFAQQPAAPGEKTGKAGLTSEEEEAVEQEVLEDLSLAPIDDPKRVAQLWELSHQLTMKRAYCRAAKYLEDIETIEGAITDNQARAAQAFFMCAKTRLSQGFVPESAEKLTRAISIVGERPEFRDLFFKMAIVRAKESINEGDIEGVRRNMEEARKLGVDLGPGAGNRVADWAIPIFHDAAGEIAGWSRDLLDAENVELADQASALALEYHPRNQLADGVRREIVMSGVVVPIVIAIIAIIVVIGMVWRFVRWKSMKKVSQEEDF